MAWLDVFSHQYFKKDRDGRTVFYPHGVLGQGLVVPDEASERKIRRYLAFNRLVFMSGLVAGIVYGVDSLWGVLLGLAVLQYGLQALAVRLLLPGAAVSDERLTLRERLLYQAAGFSPAALWALLPASLLMTLASVFAALSASTARHHLASLLGVGFFGLCTGFYGHLLWLRRWDA